MGANEKIQRQVTREQASQATPWKLSSFSQGKPVPGSSMLSAKPSDQAQFRSGYEAGKAQGLAEGRREADLQAQRMRQADRQRVDALIAGLDRQIQTTVAELDDHTADRLLALALDVAARVIGAEWAAHRECMLPIIRDAMETVAGGHQHPSIHVSAIDFAWLRELTEKDPQLHGCRLLPDPSLPPGTCRVETSQAVEDASFQTRWRKVLKSIGCESEDHPLDLDASLGEDE